MKIRFLKCNRISGVVFRLRAGGLYECLLLRRLKLGQCLLQEHASVGLHFLWPGFGSQDGPRFWAVHFYGPPICIAWRCDTPIPDGLRAACCKTRPQGYFDALSGFTFCGPDSGSQNGPRFRAEPFQVPPISIKPIVLFGSPFEICTYSI